jgi:hypothetical protein
VICDYLKHIWREKSDHSGTQKEYFFMVVSIRIVNQSLM